jgi:molybdenum cofactor cytidylyltransferase
VGIDAVSDADAACIVLGDMPWVSRGDINALLDAFDPARNALVCVPEFEGKPGNPVLWARRYFPALRALEGDRGAKALWQKNPEHVRRVGVEGSGIHRDFDVLDRAPS